MDLRGKKMGVLVSVGPDQANFIHSLRLAETALAQGISVYFYCIDEAVRGLGDAQLQALRARGLKLYACAYGAQKRGLPLGDAAMFAGLTVVSDLMASTDRFISFN